MGYLDNIIVKETLIARPNVFTHLDDQERMLQTHLKGMRKSLRKDDLDTLDTLRYAYKLVLNSYEGRFKEHFSNKLESVNKEEKWALGYDLYSHIL